LVGIEMKYFFPGALKGSFLLLSTGWIRRLQWKANPTRDSLALMPMEPRGPHHHHLSTARMGYQAVLFAYHKQISGLISTIAY
jgi:hypothetical protein